MVFLKISPVHIIIITVMCFILFLTITKQTNGTAPMAVQNANSEGSSVVHAVAPSQVDQSEENRANYDPPGIAPCGDVCSYGGSVSENSAGSFYPRRQKNMNCQTLMKRMAFTDHKLVYPPPEKPPKSLEDAYTMNGEAELLDWYIKEEFFANATHRTDSKTIDKIISDVKANIHVNTYDDQMCAHDYIKNHSAKIAGGHGVVIGTIFPWLEGILMANGAGRLTTLEYAKLVLEHPAMETFTPYNYAKKFLEGNTQPFDFAASYSSIEHSGLGRYSDPLNPYGDLEAVAQVWCMIKPGGIFIIGVPGFINGKDKVLWNAHRVYGPKRFEHMFANWDVIDRKQCDNFDHAVHIIRKPL